MEIFCNTTDAVCARDESYYVSVAGAGGPLSSNPSTQKPESLPVDADGIRAGLAAYLLNPKCAGFISKLLHIASIKVAKDNPLVAKGNLLDIFDMVRGQLGIVRDNLIGGGEARGRLGGVRADRAQMALATTRFGGNPTASEKATIQLGNDIHAALHETIHFAGLYVYDDRVLALAVQEMTGRQAPKPKGTGPEEAKAYAFANSAFWDEELRKPENCGKTP